MRRSLRIWPLYYGVLCLYIVLVRIVEHGTARGNAFMHYLPTFFTYTYTWFGPGGDEPASIFNFSWSLCTEEQFYFAWPLMIKLLRKPGPILLMSGVIIFRTLAGFHMLDFLLPPEALATRIVLTISVPICLGAVLAHILHSRTGYACLYRVLGQKWVAPAALALVAVLLAFTPQEWDPLTCLSYPLLVAACALREDNGLAAFLRWRPLVLMGVLSYGMYMFNTLSVKGVRPAMAHVGITHPLFVFPLVVALTVLVSWISYRFFETPFLNLKQRFTRSKPNAEPATEPANEKPTPVVS
jgi:peptidoglycan/LPS O-acetylase OafA/YrhL